VSTLISSYTIFGTDAPYIALYSRYLHITNIVLITSILNAVFQRCLILDHCATGYGPWPWPLINPSLKITHTSSFRIHASCYLPEGEPLLSLRILTSPVRWSRRIGVGWVPHRTSHEPCERAWRRRSTCEYSSTRVIS
jgi:hypothetical protein